VPKVYAPEFRWRIVELPLFGNAEVFFGAAGTAAQDDAEQPRPETARRLLTLRYSAVSEFGLPGRGRR
jgi:hypothetical protein